MFIDKETVDAGSLRNGHTSVGTTAQKLSTLDSKVIKGILLRCPGSVDPVSNTAPVWIGGPSVTADASVTGGIPILPGSSMMVPLERLDSLYVISTVDNQDIAWLSI